MSTRKPYHDFNDQHPGDSGNQQNLLHAARGGVMGGNEYRVMNMPRGMVYRATTQLIPTGVATAISWSNEGYTGTDNQWSINDPTKVFCRTPGLYLFIANAGFEPLAAGYRQCLFVKQPANLIYANHVFYDRDAVSVNNMVSALIPLNANDYVVMTLAQASPGNLNMRAATAPGQENSFQWCMVSTL